MAYVTLEQLQAHMKITDGVDEPLLTNAINAAVGMLERQTGRRFEAAADQWRLFLPREYDGPVLTLTEDLCQITAAGYINNASDYSAIMTADQLAGEYDDYYPANMYSPPYRFVVLEDALWQGYPMILGRWAYSVTPPEEVKQAVLAQAAHLYNYRNQLGRQEDGSMVDDTHPYMRAAIHYYRRLAAL
jgi:uncharacterized phiE125 gp8 family phage protein